MTRPDTAGVPEPGRPDGGALAGSGLLVVAIVLVGLNLRGPITALSPVLPEIQAELGLSSAAAGLLTSLPVLCFALASPLVVVIGRRLGIDRAVLVSIVVIGAAVALRPWLGAWVLLAGTAVAGLAITVGNVLLPVVVRRDFVRRPGPVLSLSTAALTGGAALAAALTAPLALLLGWRAATASWVVLALVSAAVWAVVTRGRGDPVTPASSSGGSVWRHVDGWWLAVYFGTQAGLFYAVTAWLPTMLVDLAGTGVTAAASGASVFQLLGIAGTLVVPIVAARLRSWKVLAVVIATTWFGFVGGLVLAPSAYLVWCVVGGLGQGGGLAMGLTLVALRAADVGAVRHLSAMVQMVGYTIAAVFPVLLGAAFGVTESWALPLTVLVAAAAVMAVSGVFAGASRPIGTQAE